MKKGFPKRLALYVICFVFGLLLSAFFLYVQSFSLSMPLASKYLCLSNAFTVTGTVLFGVGLLIWISNMEGFLGISYIFGHFVRMLIPGATKMDEKYGDFVDRKRGKKVTGYAFIAITGLVFLTIAVVYMYMFYSA